MAEAPEIVWPCIQELVPATRSLMTGIYFDIAGIVGGAFVWVGLIGKQVPKNIRQVISNVVVRAFDDDDITMPTRWQVDPPMTSTPTGAVWLTGSQVSKALRNNGKEG